MPKTPLNIIAEAWGADAIRWATPLGNLEVPGHHWREALNHFTILWPERMPALERIPQ